MSSSSNVEKLNAVNDIKLDMLKNIMLCNDVKLKQVLKHHAFE
jgi:hypothetical protein